MARFLREVKTLEITPTSNVQCGDMIKIFADFYGIAPSPIAANETAAVIISGVAAEKAIAAVTAGAALYAGDGGLTPTSAAGAKVGVALEAASSGSAVRFLLNK